MFSSRLEKQQKMALVATAKKADKSAKRQRVCGTYRKSLVYIIVMLLHVMYF
jgi:hypothetical protein